MDTKIKLYLCRGMSGRIKSDVVSESKTDKQFFERAGFKVLCPVAEENVKPSKQVLMASKDEISIYWKRDKKMIREAHILLDMTPHLNSEGSKHEIGYGRYNLWKPVIRVFPEGKIPPDSSIAHFEDDAVVDTREFAVEYILRVHGTFYKRLKWRLSMLNRCLLKWLIFQAGEFK